MSKLREPNGKAAPIQPQVMKRSIVLAQHKTSISLEEPFWQALKDIALDRHLTVAALVEQIDGAREGANLSSACRLFVLNYFRNQPNH